MKDDISVIKEAGGLEALLERVSLQQQQLVQKVVTQSDARWQKRMEEQDAMWEARAQGLLEKVGTVTDDKINKAIQASEKKQEKVMKKLQEQMSSQFKKENDFQGDVKKLTETVEEMKKNEVKPAVPVAGGSSSNGQPGGISQVSHRIGDAARVKSFREKDPGILQFSGKDAVDKSQAVEKIVETLSGLGIDKTGYSISGQSRGNRFSVKFKSKVGHHSRAQDAAEHVMTSLAPSGGGKWKTVQFNRVPDGEPVEYGFYKDMPSNQVVKEIVIKHIYNSIKDLQGAGDFEMYKKDGTLYQGFKCVARVIVGFKEDTFQVKWVDANAVEKLGIKTKDIDQELRRVYAKWCL
jgi:hypothetical protein